VIEERLRRDREEKDRVIWDVEERLRKQEQWYDILRY